MIFPSPDSSGGDDSLPHAAVAVVVRLNPRGPEVLLGRRRSNPEDPWSGHVALPGGRKEEIDHDLLDTALRELAEESGIVLSRGHLTGRLPDTAASLPQRRPLRVRPWLFLLDEVPHPGTTDGEIDAWTWWPLAFLQHSAHREGGRDGWRVTVNTPVGELWGMTLGILDDLWHLPLVQGARRLVLDFDGTVYPSHHPLVEAVDSRITGWIQRSLGDSRQCADQRRIELLRLHGNTLRGLLAEGDLEDPALFLDHVFDLPDEVFPGADPSLRTALQSCGLPVGILTNARADYVRRGLRALGIDDLADEVIDLPACGHEPKPHPTPYVKAETRWGHAGLVFLDDVPANLVTAAARGWTTVLVGPTHTGNVHIDWHLPRAAHISWLVLPWRKASSV